MRVVPWTTLNLPNHRPTVQGNPFVYVFASCRDILRNNRNEFSWVDIMGFRPPVEMNWDELYSRYSSVQTDESVGLRCITSLWNLIVNSGLPLCTRSRACFCVSGFCSDSSRLAVLKDGTKQFVNIHPIIYSLPRIG